MKANFNIAKNVRNSRSISALAALRKLQSLGLLLCTLMIGGLQVWGATTYKLTSVTSVSAGNKYVFVQSGYAMKGTVNSNYVETTNSYATTGLSGTESYVWTLEAGTEPSTSNSGFYIRNCSTTVYVRNSDDSGTKLTLPTNTGSPAGTSTRMVWSFAFSGSTATISCVANSRVLAYAGASDYRYRAYASNTSNPKSITVYRLDEEASGYAVTYNNGGHGTAPSSTTASNVTLSAITGVTGYTCTGWKANVNVKNTSTSATISAGTLISNGTNVTLLGATTFTAQWEVTKYTVTFAVNVAGYGSVSQATVTNVPHGTTPTSSSNTVTVNGTTVTATPHDPDADYNYAFSSWSGIPASITGACTITANFTRTERTLTNYRTRCCEKKIAAPDVTATKTAYTITLSWAAVTSGNGNATAYEMQWNGGDWETVTSPVEKTSLTPNTDYTWNVRVKSWSGDYYCGAEETGEQTTTTNNVYTVTYNKGDGGSGTMTDANSPYEAGDEVTVLENSFTKGGWSFNGWSYSPSVTVEEGKFAMPAENVTITATWVTKKNYYVDRMHGNWDGEHTVTIGGKAYNCYLREGAGYTVPEISDNSTGENSCVTGHAHFVGWTTSSNFNAQGEYTSGKIYVNGETNTANADGTIYYAVWAEE